MSETNGQLASRDELRAATSGKRRFDVVTLPVSGLNVRIRSLTEGEMSRWQKAAMSSRGRGMLAQKIADSNRRLIVLCVVDDKANVMFSAADAVQLSEWDSADTNYLANECNRHCGLDPEDMEMLVKNCDEISGADSPTSSPDSAAGST